MATRAAKLAKRQARATARIGRIQTKYGLIPSGVTVPASALPQPAASSPITAVMDTAPTTTVPTPSTTTLTTPAPVDPLAPPLDILTPSPSSMVARTPLPRLTKQQIRYERKQLKLLPKQIARINKLNRLRELQEFTLNQQTEQAPDYSTIRGGPQLAYQRGGTEGGSAAYYDPMSAGVSPGPGAPYPGSFGPPQNFFSPPAQFQPSMGYPPGGSMMPPSQSGVPGGLIYMDQPQADFYTPYPEMDVNAEPVFEDEGEQFFAYGVAFANVEPLDSYGAVTGEPAQVSFFDKLSGLISAGGQKYADVQTAKYQAKYAKPVRPAAPPEPKAFSPQTMMAMGLIVLGGFLILRAQRS